MLFVRAQGIVVLQGWKIYSTNATTQISQTCQSNSVTTVKTTSISIPIHWHLQMASFDFPNLPPGRTLKDKKKGEGKAKKPQNKQ